MSKLLINETPLMMSPTLAAKIGVDEALILQQIHYLINPDINQNLIDGKHWVYNTYPEWHQRFKRCWSESTIKNIFLKLEKLKLLIVGRFNKTKDDRTKWYTIDYDELGKLEVGTTDKNCLRPRTKIVQPIRQKLSEASDKNCPMYKEQEITYQKITTIENKTRASEEASDVDLTVDDSFYKSVDKEEIKEKQKSYSVDTPDFLSFWQQYPCKTGKGAARRAFRTAIKKTSISSILRALEEQMVEKEESARLGVWMPLWANPSTWLNQERWEDVVKTSAELRGAAKTNLTQKMSYRDRTAVQSAMNREARESRIRARQSVIEGSQ